MDIFSNKPKPDAKDDKETELRPWRQAGSARENEAFGRNDTGGPNIQPIQPMGSTPMSDVAQFRQTPKGSPTPPENCASVISAGSAWQGSLKIDGSVRIEGRLSGEVETQETVHVMEGAQVDANISAAFVVIAGTFQGQVDCSERLELMPKSRTKGELTTKLLTVHEGAFIDGQLHMQDPMSADNRQATPGRPSTAAVRPREASPTLSASNIDSVSTD